MGTNGIRTITCEKKFFVIFSQLPRAFFSVIELTDQLRQTLKLLKLRNLEVGDFQTYNFVKCYNVVTARVNSWKFYSNMTRVI